ncbi:MAG: hypothetical protein WD059_01735 [Balneolaceae bacterium]
MKTFNSILKITCAVAIVAMTFACETISNPEPIDAINEEKMATIQGTAYANLDETNDTTGVILERAPANTNVKVVLDAADFVNIAPGVDYQNLSYTTTVDGSGNFEIEIPALDEPINAEIYLDSFIANQFKADSTNESRLFTPAAFPINASIVADFTSYHNVTYVAN